MDEVERSGDAAAGRSFLPPRTLLAGIVAMLVGLGGTFGVSTLLHRAAAAPAPLQAQLLPSRATQPWAAPDLTLKDQAGQTVSLSSLRGQVVVVTFMDPQCQTLCPINAQVLTAAEADLAPNIQPVPLVVSVAPDRTPADVSNFVSHVTWRPGWHWLLGNQAELQAVWSTWSLAMQGTDVVHEEIDHVINKQGQVVASLHPPYPPTDLAAIITTQWSK